MIALSALRRSNCFCRVSQPQTDLNRLLPQYWDLHHHASSLHRHASPPCHHASPPHYLFVLLGGHRVGHDYPHAIAMICHRNHHSYRPVPHHHRPLLMKSSQKPLFNHSPSPPMKPPPTSMAYIVPIPVGNHCSLLMTDTRFALCLIVQTSQRIRNPRREGRGGQLSNLYNPQTRWDLF